MLSSMQTDLVSINNEMRNLAAKFKDLHDRATRLVSDAEAEATAEDTADLPTRNQQYMAVAEDARKVIEQLDTLPAWADAGDPEEPPAEKYRVTQMVKGGQTLWVVVRNDPSKSQWPVFSARYRHHAIQERDRLNSETPGRSMYAKRMGR